MAEKVFRLMPLI